MGVSVHHGWGSSRFLPFIYLFSAKIVCYPKVITVLYADDIALINSTKFILRVKAPLQSHFLSPEMVLRMEAPLEFPINGRIAWKNSVSTYGWSSTKSCADVNKFITPIPKRSELISNPTHFSTIEKCFQNRSEKPAHLRSPLQAPTSIQSNRTSRHVYP